MVFKARQAKTTEATSDTPWPDPNLVEKKYKNMGRPKGSKNKITVLKLMAEEEFRNNNKVKVNQVLDLIVEQALEGCTQSQKLVWNSVVSAGLPDEAKTAEKVQINIGSIATPTIEEPTVLEGEVVEVVEVPEEPEPPVSPSFRAPSPLRE